MGLTWTSTELGDTSLAGFMLLLEGRTARRTLFSLLLCYPRQCYYSFGADGSTDLDFTLEE